MNNNIYKMFLDSGQTLQDFVAEKSSEWGISESAVTNSMIPDMARHREPLYPELREQLDALWHGMNQDETKRIEPFYTMIKEIKEENPKPSIGGAS